MLTIWMYLTVGMGFNDGEKLHKCLDVQAVGPVVITI